MSKVIEISDANFDETVLEAAGKVVVDFWAPWCGPCRMIGPAIEKLAEEHPDVTVCKLNVDENPQSAARFRVMSIPLVLAFENGAVTGQLLGAVPAAQLEALVA